MRYRLFLAIIGQWQVPSGFIRLINLKALSINNCYNMQICCMPFGKLITCIYFSNEYVKDVLISLYSFSLVRFEIRLKAKHPQFLSN